ncbi:MAG: hypothetical protein QUS33_09860 [Dehalococcoidia bacterium]|nr:hypothetical protein [Dehalococcoidia bacterium]
MFRRVLLVVCLGALLATMAVATTGCASGSGLMAMLAKVPADTVSLKYVNVKALRNDADLEDLYDAWKERVQSRLQNRGISPSEVNIFASNEALSKRFTLLTGTFDLDEVRDELEDRHYEKDDYRGVEVWIREAGWASDLENQVALMGDLIIMGDESGVEACIKVIKAGGDSWLSKVDINDVANRLPGGIYVEMAKEWTSILASGFEAYGISAKKQDSETLKIAGVAKFNDEDDADDAVDTIEDIMDQRFDGAQVTQEGLFLKATARIDIDDAKGLF